jgi:hypothetical protein
MADASRPEPLRASSSRAVGDQTRGARDLEPPDLVRLAADLTEAIRRVEHAEAILERLEERLRRHEEAHSLGGEPRRSGHRGLGSLFGRAS